METRIDIHNVARRIVSTAKSIETSSLILPRNKELILEFDRVLAQEGLSPGRRTKYLGDLKRFAERHIKVDMDRATDAEIRDAVLSVEADARYSLWTKHGYKVVIRKLFKWLAQGQDYLTRKDYPRSVAWIKPNIKKKDRPKVKANDLLTEEEVELLIRTADTTRDKAFYSLLYELGARVGEIGSMKIKDVSRHKHGFLLDLDGKTGRRTPLVVLSTPYLSAWLAAHPDANNPDAPLWVCLLIHRRGKALAYRSMRSNLAKAVQRAGIKKHIYHHLFRHSRVTHLLASGKLNEAQAKVFFGWTPESPMLSEYSHLVCGDVHKAILAIHGIVDKEELKYSTIQCAACATVCPQDAVFCLRCGSTLKVMDGEEAEGEDRALIEKVMADPEFHKMMVEKIKSVGLLK